MTTFTITDTREGAAVVQVAKNVTEEIVSARRLRQLSEELAAANGRLVATVERLKTTQAQLLQAEKLSAIVLSPCFRRSAIDLGRMFSKSRSDFSRSMRSCSRYACS